MNPTYYIVKAIDGDYAHLNRIGTDEIIVVARALLPFETEEGMKLKQEMMEYEIVE